MMSSHTSGNDKVVFPYRHATLESGQMGFCLGVRRSMSNDIGHSTFTVEPCLIRSRGPMLVEKCSNRVLQHIFGMTHSKHVFFYLNIILLFSTQLVCYYKRYKRIFFQNMYDSDVKTVFPCGRSKVLPFYFNWRKIQYFFY